MNFIEIELYNIYIFLSGFSRVELHLWDSFSSIADFCSFQFLDSIYHYMNILQLIYSWIWVDSSLELLQVILHE